MKKYLFIVLAACSGLGACQSPTDKVHDFIPGSYVNAAKSEFSVANDTLVIAPVDGTENSFSVTRRTGYRLLVKGKPSGLHHKVKRWTATWNKDTQALTVLETGKTLRFLPDQRVLLNGKSRYRKL